MLVIYSKRLDNIPTFLFQGLPKFTLNNWNFLFENIASGIPEIKCPARYRIESNLGTVKFYSISDLIFLRNVCNKNTNKKVKRPSLAHFGIKNILFYFLKLFSLLQRWRCSCQFKVVGLAHWYQDIQVGDLERM
jgi:hypothetical protein